MLVGPIDFPLETISGICQKYDVEELSVFGSVLHADFRVDSDIDLLVHFRSDARIGFIKYLSLQDELAALLQRKVDLVDKDGIKPLLRPSVLREARVLYAD